ncbi:acyl transferase/acyl hydrolase/lysophospholipase [Mycena rebaudengoi]|nr:acyl transferase/acyl hydrolase/lysophospholipase [Mycena rebaudengoi]
MIHQDSSLPGLRLLCFDGGGIRGLSSLVILERIMYSIQKEQRLDAVPLPCEYFDLMGGTSTGGLIALMLGRLRMSVADAIGAYENLAQGVFSETKYFFQDGKFKASRLEAAIKTIVSQKCPSRDPEELMNDSSVEQSCPTFVCAQSAHTFTGNIPVVFRTYSSPDEPAAECKIWEAARATSAAPTFFKRIKIGDGLSAEVFIDGGLGRNNPTGILLEEAQVLFPSRKVACVVSIGTGQVKTINIPRPSVIQRIIPSKVAKATVAIATDCEATNQEMLKRFSTTPGVYFRFNVDQGMQAIKLGAWERLTEVKAHTRNYRRHEEVRAKLGEVVQVLIKGTACADGR